MYLQYQRAPLRITCSSHVVEIVSFSVFTVVVTVLARIERENA
jgi:hypothetical protein